MKLGTLLLWLFLLTLNSAVCGVIQGAFRIPQPPGWIGRIADFGVVFIVMQLSYLMA